MTFLNKQKGSNRLTVSRKPFCYRGLLSVKFDNDKKSRSYKLEYPGLQNLVIGLDFRSIIEFMKCL